MAIVDLRGSPTGLAELGEGLASLIAALKHDPDDELREMFLERPELMVPIAQAESHRRRQVRELGLGDDRGPDAGSKGFMTSVKYETISRELM